MVAALLCSLRDIHEINVYGNGVSVCPCVYTFRNSTSTGRILMKFGMDIMPSQTTPNTYLLIPMISNTNMADARISEIGTTLAPLNIRSWNYEL
jgi:hypothetical protein